MVLIMIMTRASIGHTFSFPGHSGLFNGDNGLNDQHYNDINDIKMMIMTLASIGHTFSSPGHKVFNMIEDNKKGKDGNGYDGGTELPDIGDHEDNMDFFTTTSTTAIIIITITCSMRLVIMTMT